MTFNEASERVEKLWSVVEISSNEDGTFSIISEGEPYGYNAHTLDVNGHPAYHGFCITREEKLA